MIMETLKTHTVHGGTLRYLRHDSDTTDDHADLPHRRAPRPSGL